MKNRLSFHKIIRIIQLLVFIWIMIRFLLHLRDIMSLRGAQKQQQQKPNISNGILAGITSFIKDRAKPSETHTR